MREHERLRYLVTGGLGVVGSEFVRVLLAEGHDVKIIDSAEERRNDWTWGALLAAHAAASKRPDARFNALQLVTARIETLGRTIEDHLVWADRVLHAAAFTGIPESANAPEDDWASNAEGTRVLLEGLRRLKAARHRVPSVVVTSSVKPYDLRGGVPATGVDESFPIDPDEPYAASKVAQSALAVAYARSYDLPITVFRCSNLYGPAPCHGPRHGWLTWFCIQAALGWPIRVEGGGDQVRDMLHTSDVTAAVIAAFDWMDARAETEPPGGFGRLYNVGGGPAFKIAVRDAIAMLRRHGLVVTIDAPARKLDDRIFVTNYQRFTDATGWYPRVAPADGIADVFTWARANAADLRKLYAGLPGVPTDAR